MRKARRTQGAGLCSPQISQTLKAPGTWGGTGCARTTRVRSWEVVRHPFHGLSCIQGRPSDRWPGCAGDAAERQNRGWLALGCRGYDGHWSPGRGTGFNFRGMWVQSNLSDFFSGTPGIFARARKAEGLRISGKYASRSGRAHIRIQRLMWGRGRAAGSPSPTSSWGSMGNILSENFGDSAGSVHQTSWSWIEGQWRIPAGAEPWGRRGRERPQCQRAGFGRAVKNSTGCMAIDLLGAASSSIYGPPQSSEHKRRTARGKTSALDGDFSVLSLGVSVSISDHSLITAATHYRGRTPPEHGHRELFAGASVAQSGTLQAGRPLRVRHGGGRRHDSADACRWATESWARGWALCFVGPGAVVARRDREITRPSIQSSTRRANRQLGQMHWARGRRTAPELDRERLCVVVNT